MRRIGRLLAQLLMTAVFATALSFAVPGFVHRRGFTKAVADYVKNPNSENDAILKVERAKNQEMAFRTHVEVAGVLFVLMNAGYFAMRRWPAGSSKGSPKQRIEGST
jgi:hypothetical protein